MHILRNSMPMQELLQMPCRHASLLDVQLALIMSAQPESASDSLLCASQ